MVEIQTLRAQLEDTTVAVRRSGSGLPEATGWLFSDGGYILTAAHALFSDAPQNSAIVNSCQICFNWGSQRPDDHNWLNARICFVGNDEDEMLDFAVLKVSRSNIPPGRVPLPLLNGEPPYGQECCAFGYHGGEERMVFLHSMRLTGDTDARLLRLTTQSLVEGFSGCPIATWTNGKHGVFAMSLARYDSQIGAERDTRFVLPVARISEHWAPLEDLAGHVTTPTELFKRKVNFKAANVEHAITMHIDKLEMKYETTYSLLKIADVVDSDEWSIMEEDALLPILGIDVREQSDNVTAKLDLTPKSRPDGRKEYTISLCDRGGGALPVVRNEDDQPIRFTVTYTKPLKKGINYTPIGKTLHATIIRSPRLVVKCDRLIYIVKRDGGYERRAQIPELRTSGKEGAVFQKEGLKPDDSYTVLIVFGRRAKKECADG